MYDRLNRVIEYLRISLTDRCNFSCIYCKTKNTPLISKKMILTFEEIEKTIKVLTNIGIKHIRFTGGEPLLRKDICILIKKIKSINSIESVSLTTNGFFLKENAYSLYESGLDSINISIDSLIEKTFSTITAGNKLSKTIEGLNESKKHFKNIKVNIVITSYIIDEIENYLKFASKNNVVLRFIELMPFGKQSTPLQSINESSPSAMSTSAKLYNDLYIPINKFKKEILKYTALLPKKIKLGNGPAEYYYSDKYKTTIGMISPVTERFCASCNRIRLNASGTLYPCIHSSSGMNIREIFRNNSKDNALKIIKDFIYNKPIEHRFESEGLKLDMSKIGG